MTRVVVRTRVGHMRCTKPEGGEKRIVERGVLSLGKPPQSASQPKVPHVQEVLQKGSWREGQRDWATPGPKRDGVIEKRPGIAGKHTEEP
jgi:hypothetical protein